MADDVLGGAGSHRSAGRPWHPQLQVRPGGIIRRGKATRVDQTFLVVAHSEIRRQTHTANGNHFRVNLG